MYDGIMYPDTVYTNPATMMVGRCCVGHTCVAAVALVHQCTYYNYVWGTAGQLSAHVRPS